LDRVTQAAERANEALHWLETELNADAPNERLLPMAEYFLEALDESQEWLAPAGLDLPLRDRVAALLAR
jgi:hypothetical protein